MSEAINNNFKKSVAESITFDLEEKDLKAIDFNKNKQNEIFEMSEEELDGINGGFAIRNANLKLKKLDGINGGFAIRNANLKLF